MTTLHAVPSPGSLAWRAISPTPRDVRDDLAAFCPIDDSVLVYELGGRVCPTCLGWWDMRGRRGRWLTDPMVAPAVAPVRARIFWVSAVVALFARVAAWVAGLLHRGRQAPLDVLEAPVEITRARLRPTCRRWRRG